VGFLASAATLYPNPLPLFPVKVVTALAAVQGVEL